MMHRVRTMCFVGLLLTSLSGAAVAQPMSGDDYQQRMTNALASARQSAEQLNNQHKTLLDTINQAADAQQAQRFLDSLIGTSTQALSAFSENSEVMKAINGLLVHIDQRRKNAEDKVASDPRWVDRVNQWKAYGDNFRQLRQELLKEADRAGNLLGQLKKDKAFIEDIIAGESVARAKQEMEMALKNLRELGDALADAVNVAEERNKKITAPSS